MNHLRTRKNARDAEFQALSRAIRFLRLARLFHAERNPARCAFYQVKAIRCFNAAEQFRREAGR